MKLQGKMKIAHIVWGMKTGGVETMLVNIINEQVKTEMVHLYIINDFCEESIVKTISPCCKIFKLNRRPGSKNPLFLLRLNYWIWTYNPDIIHVHSTNVSRLVWGKWNIVRTIHGMNNAPKEYPRMKALFSISKAVSDFTKEQNFSSTIIMNGINVSEITPKVHCNIIPPVFKIVQVSRLAIESKGQDLLLQALKILENNGIYNFHMYFIGEGPSEEFLKDMVKNLNLNKYVTFEGLRSQEYLHHHLRDYDIFVQPSRNEGFGLTVTEAMAARLPIIASDIQGPMEVIGYGEYGIYFQCGNVKDLAEKLKHILQGGYDYSLIEKAYQRVCNEYDVKRTARKYIEEYRKILEK